MIRKLPLLICAASLLLGGCIQWEYQRWSGPIPLETIAFESEYDPPTGQFIRHNHLEILSIQRVGAGKVIYPPSGEYKTLWLEPGEYRAKIKCDRTPSDGDLAGITKTGTALDADQMFDFSLKLEPQGTVQIMDCAIGANGQVFVSVLEGIEVIAT